MQSLPRALVFNVHECILCYLFSSVCFEDEMKKRVKLHDLLTLVHEHSCLDRNAELLSMLFQLLL